MYGPSPEDDMINFGFGTVVTYDIDGDEILINTASPEFNKAFDEIFKETLPPECKNEAPIDGYRAFDKLKEMIGR